MENEKNYVLEQYYAKSKIASAFGVAAVVFFICAIICGIVVYSPFWGLREFGNDTVFVYGFFLSIILMIVMMIIGGKIHKSCKTLTYPLKDAAIRNTAKQFPQFQLKSYFPKEHMSKWEVDSAGFFCFDRIEGSDLIEGTYRGKRVCFSDLELVDSNAGDPDQSAETVFKGTFLKIECDRSIRGGVRIGEGGVGGIFRQHGKKVRTENERFNKQFTIKSTYEEEAFYVLTPQFMEAIVNADAYAGARTKMYFCGNEIVIALWHNVDLFEMSPKISAPEFEAMVKKQFNYIFNILDILMIDTAMFDQSKINKTVH